jgi:glutamate racemase
MGDQVALIDSAEQTAITLEETLTSSNLEAGRSDAGVHRFAVSDDEPRFRQVGSRFIGARLSGAEVISLG